MARAALLLAVAGLLPACSAVEPFPESERRYREELARVGDLRDLVPLMLRTPDREFLFEQSLLRMIELSAGPQARKDVDDFLDLCEARLRQILREQPPTSVGKLFWALKGLWLDLDLQFKEPAGTREGRPRDPEEISILPLARRREGRCGSFSQMYLCLAERLDLPVSYVRLPRHAFIRLKVDGKEANFETNQPVWARERKDEFYVDHFGGPGSAMDGHPFYLRSLKRRQAGIDAIWDEIAAVWAGEGRYAEILALCDAAEPSVGPDAFLERRFWAAYCAGYNLATREVRDPEALREGLKLAEKIQKLNPGESGYSMVALFGYQELLKDSSKALEVARQMLLNPRLSDEARAAAAAALKD